MAQIINSERHPIHRLTFSARSLAHHLGVSLRHLRRLDKDGRIPAPIRLGRRALWSVVEINDWLAAGAPCREDWIMMKKGRP